MQLLFFICMLCGFYAADATSIEMCDITIELDGNVIEDGETVVFIAGELNQLVCKATCSRILMWYKGDRLLRISFAREYRTTDEMSLTIRNMLQRDTGVYKCTGWISGLGFREKTVILAYDMCKSNQLECDQRCHPIEYKCDGIPDCIDGSDEFECGCGTQFTCDIGGSCVPQNKVCDGNFDCIYGEDESNCSCVGGFKCKDGTCLDISAKCNCTTECTDGEDEPSVCDCFGYTCFDGTCIGKADVCDGKSDCLLGDDEDNCTCYKDQFQCNGDFGECVDTAAVCDGVADCFNSADETGCPHVVPGSIEIELVDGPSASAGRVEVINSGERGTICDDAWDDNDATVVCKMLGYSFGTAQIEGYYGPGSESISILLDDVECDGVESSISQCVHSGWGTSNCVHREDAGVKCYMGVQGGDQIQTDQDDQRSSFICGLRPLELVSRKKREEPDSDGRDEKEFGLPPKFGRIIGGSTAAKGFYPWQVGVRKYDHNGVYGHLCGGTILSPNWILSAAHCFEDVSKGSIVVRTGDHDNKVDDKFEQQFELKELISHPLYDGDNYNNDIALLKVSPLCGSGIKFNDYVQPACLPDETDEYVSGKKCHVSGWGLTEHGNPNLLKSARVPLIDDTTCKRMYKEVTDKMICAGYLAGGNDACFGDSGGPLVCEINGRYTVMGVTSWGRGCARANAPGVYAKVTEFLPWIKSTIRQYSYILVPGSVEIELVDGPSASAGRVEVINNGERGTICDDSWDDNDATVVCKMLGYSFGTAQIEGYYGPGSESISILLDDVECDGVESSISQCVHSGWGTSNCWHWEDAGVECYMGVKGGDQIQTDQDDELSSFTCGLRPLELVSRKKRIIGGFTAAKGFYPWQVGVRRYVQNGVYRHRCGGTILSPNWILSAASCFVDVPKALIVVRTGDHDNKVVDEFEQQFELKELISHPLFDGDNYNNDIALLKVSPLRGSGIKFNDYVQPACLPDETDEYVSGKKCHVSGWGLTEHGYQNLLKSARVPLIDDTTCKRMYKEVTDKMVCAGYLSGGIDTCSGDLGGPLVCEINGRYTVMGVTSWGRGCARANAPGVYAKVTEFLPWIKSTIREYS